MSPEHEFDAPLELDDADGGFFVVLPVEVADAYRTTGRIYVQATFDGIAHHGTAKPLGNGEHALPIPKQIRRALGKTLGDPVRVTLRRA